MHIKMCQGHGIVAHNGGAGGVVAHRRWRRARREGAAVKAVSSATCKSAAVGMSRAGRSSILHPTHKTFSPPSPPFPFNCT